VKTARLNRVLTKERQIATVEATTPIRIRRFAKVTSSG